MIMEENVIVIRDPKSFYFVFDWPKNVDDNFKHETEFIIKSNESFAENKTKEKIEQFLLNVSIEIIFMNTENSKTSEPHKCVLNLSQRLDLRSWNEDVGLQNLSIYYTWKNIGKQYKNSKLKIIAPTWMINFNYHMVLILGRILKIISNISLKNMKT